MTRLVRSSRWLALIVVAMVAGCATNVPNTDPVGRTLPSITGEALDGTPRAFPQDLNGKSAVLIVAYKQRTQFDVDRWLLGLLQLETPVQIFELPTIDSAIASVLSGTIDEGMRSGIPSEDWASVVTVYDEADTLVAFLGNEGGQNARVLLVDGRGNVVWFHDRGFSPSQVKDLDDQVRRLDAKAPPAP